MPWQPALHDIEYDAMMNDYLITPSHNNYSNYIENKVSFKEESTIFFTFFFDFFIVVVLFERSLWNVTWKFIQILFQECKKIHINLFVLNSTSTKQIEWKRRWNAIDSSVELFVLLSSSLS